MLKSAYTVQDGKIKDASNSNDQGTLIPVSGEKPSSGELHYSNNVLKGGCLVVGDYEVTFKSDGSVDKTVKGDCSDYVFSSEQGGSSSDEQATNPYLTSFDGTYVYKMESAYSEGYTQDENEWYTSLNSSAHGYIRKNVSTQEIEVCTVFNSNTVCVKNNSDDYAYGSDIVCDSNDENCYLKQGYLASKKDEFESKGATCEVDNQYSLTCYYNDVNPILIITPFSEDGYTVPGCTMADEYSLHCF